MPFKRVRAVEGVLLVVGAAAAVGQRGAQAEALPASVWKPTPRVLLMKAPLSKVRSKQRQRHDTVFVAAGIFRHIGHAQAQHRLSPLPGAVFGDEESGRSSASARQ
jgi:hypothetical protein